MPNRTVKRCVRPQCMGIYEVTEKNRFCMCGALLQIAEIDIKTKKAYKNPVNFSKPKINPIPKQDDVVVQVSNEERTDSYSEEAGEEKKAHLYLLLEEDDVEFELSDITRIGRAADGVKIDIDLSDYAGKDVSREHAVIRKEKDGYYITNVSKNHSVRLMDQDDKEVALEYGNKALLKTGEGIILSKKILLQFEEE